MFDWLREIIKYEY